VTTPNPERFHLTLTSAGRPVMHGWWASEATARGMLPAWVGSWGEMPGARITLVDEETGSVLTVWPDEA
jgi:acyl-coenzyme A synthetase/AMP-(fatty) acid ligase